MNMETNKKEHWENVYNTKQLSEVSWYQPTPQISLDFIKEANLQKDAAIIDVGGGDSLLADHLLNLGYTNISVLDISQASLDRAKVRLGEKASRVKWIVSDMVEFDPSMKYDFWHDRAAFHFLTGAEQINRYKKVVENSINKNGHLVIGTFSENGPKKCSGLEIKQYTEESLIKTFETAFTRMKCKKEEHVTPFHTTQNFLFCSFRRK
jgi:2-polyprenyl-3-methyl-5-hydroxy-6-metoxy-1,4-benzoquinol methylase